jgi:hypothetical protein
VSELPICAFVIAVENDSKPPTESAEHRHEVGLIEIKRKNVEGCGSVVDASGEKIQQQTPGGLRAKGI